MNTAERQHALRPRLNVIVEFALQQDKGRWNSRSQDRANEFLHTLYRMRGIARNGDVDPDLAAHISLMEEIVHCGCILLFRIQGQMKAKVVPKSRLRARRKRMVRARKRGIQVFLGALGCNRRPEWWVLPGNTPLGVTQSLTMAARLLCSEDRHATRYGWQVERTLRAHRQQKDHEHDEHWSDAWMKSAMLGPPTKRNSDEDPLEDHSPNQPWLSLREPKRVWSLQLYSPCEEAVARALTRLSLHPWFLQRISAMRHEDARRDPEFAAALVRVETCANATMHGLE